MDDEVGTHAADSDEGSLEISIVYAAGTIFTSLLFVQLLHSRPSALLTHGGACMLVGAALNCGVYVCTTLVGRPRVISVVVSPGVHDVVYFGLIPPIIFEAGFSMRKRGFFDNLVPILLFALLGTLISTFSAGWLLNYLSTHGIIVTPLSIGDALLFAALISPTDPVATLSVLRQLNAPSTLRNCIFGEATVNDALSIVLFNIIRRQVDKFDKFTKFDAEHFITDIGSEMLCAPVSPRRQLASP